MITYKNYYQHFAKLDRTLLDDSLMEASILVDDVTKKGKDWTVYLKDEVIKRVIDLYFEQLSAFIKSLSEPVQKKHSRTSSITKQNNTIKPTKHSKESKSKQPNNAPKKPVSVKSKSNLRVVKRGGQLVERISESIQFLNRYVNLHGKYKVKTQILKFINSLQRAIREKRINNSSPFPKEIDKLQDDLIKLHNSFKDDNAVIVSIGEQTRNHLYNVIGKQELMSSVKFMKNYITLQGKIITNKQATSLHNRIAKAMNNSTITEKDPYWDELNMILTNLKSFVRKNKSEGVLHIPVAELHGLNGILNGFGSTINGLNGFDTAPKNTIMNSEDFVKLKFDKIGFTGKWLNFIGNPSKGFIILVSAPAKYGKSIMCVDFAGYLARNHGVVLYVAKEEGLDDTLKEKLMRAAHPNLIVSDFLPEDLSEYDYVFLDSITRLQLSPEDLIDMKTSNPGVSLIAISQVNKAGSARGSNAFTHDVDSIIEFPERGKAVQYGRFNQGGEMDIFNNHQNQQS